MYHYIRDFNNEFPYFNFLSQEKFNKQVEMFNKFSLVKDHQDIFKENKKILLTFDDGLKDHIMAAETLKKINSFGIFFIPTLPISDNNILDTHKTHFLLGRVKAIEVLEQLKYFLKKKRIDNFINNEEEKKFQNAYKKTDDDKFQKIFKKIINYNSNLKLRTKVLDHLLQFFDVKISAKKIYMNAKEIKYIQSLGMIIGCHSQNHNLLSRMSYNNQYLEIKKSKIFLEKIIKKKVELFCYPFGGKISYNKDTLKILKKLKFKQGYSVYNKIITKKDLINNNFELPRYDCKLF
ncbi:polysaccharide deacetylase family protein [Candidatus Pelagibacter sp.]|uniref:polysaccharide deacetylase family protein n=1 Tax=Candidatus Pelagibacter sp. TaxID=2024849 RepID=UPI003F86999F